MYTLSVQSFRCYDVQRNCIETPLFHIVGPNGVGKTSFLEALSLFTPGKGLRSAAPSDLQKTDATLPWRASLHIETPTGPLLLETSCVDGVRKVWANESPLKSHAMMRQWVNMIWPMMLNTDTMTQRRNYLNRLVFSLDVQYGALWLQYEKALRQRNAMLQEGQSNIIWYESIEKVLAQTAAAIFQKRNHALNLVESAMRHQITPFPVPRCVMHGPAETILIQDPTGENYALALGQNRAVDRMKKTTSFGLHKTRFEWFHPHGREWGLCSTGEQKGLLLSVALAVFRTSQISQPHGVHFFLLDEGMAHLDKDRQAWLWDELSHLEGYILVTGTQNDVCALPNIERWVLMG